MDNFIYDYFVNPIWDRTGYNVVNTAVYATIALVAIYALNQALRGRVKMDEGFVRGVLCFVLFGSTMRVVTDSIDNGVFKPVTPIHQMVLQSHLWDYGYLTVTPGIYVLTAALLLISLRSSTGSTGSDGSATWGWPYGCRISCSSCRS